MQNTNGFQANFGGQLNFGVPGKDGGYYLVNAEQINANTLRLTFTPSQSGMPQVDQVDIEIPGATDEQIRKIVEEYLGNASDKAVLYTEQTLTPEQQAQARKNIGADTIWIDILDVDPTEPKEGQMWILKTTNEALTTPVIELGTVGENSVEIKLSNASFDGSGSVVRSYNIYVNGTLSKTETIEAGGTCVVAGLSPETEYQISIRGVKDAVLSGASNTLTATTEPSNVVDGEMVIVIGVTAGKADGNISLNTWAGNKRATAVYTAGKKACVNQLSDDVYYPIPVPTDATSVTIVCPGMKCGYSGWNLSDANSYSYDVDSGYLFSGTTYTFEAGAAEYATVTVMKESDDITDADLANITITFGTSSNPEPEPEPEPEPDYVPEFVVLSGYAGGSYQGNISLNARSDRSTAVCTAGKKACINGPSGEYYPIPVPADATSVTVVCPGYRFGYNGWNLSDTNEYSYDVDSGWKDSGATYTFEAGASEYATVGFNALIPEEAFANITITFA